MGNLIPPRAGEFAALAQLVEAFRDRTDDLTPDQYAVLDVVVDNLAPYVHRVESSERSKVASGRPKAPKAPKAVRAREEDWWSWGAAKKVVHQRSGGDCELRSPYCKGRATNVHHAFGRRGDDPHHPDRLLDLCGMGNIDGCHGWAHGAYGGGGREAAQAVCHGFAAERGESL